jgi:hypothetical protein
VPPVAGTVPPAQPLSAAVMEHTASTMRHAVGQKVPVAATPPAGVPAGAGGPGATEAHGATPSEERSALRRVMVIAATGMVLAGMVLVGMFWGDFGGTAAPEGAAAKPAVPAMSLVRIELDQKAQIIVDDVPHEPAQRAEIPVSPGHVHKIRLKVEGGRERKVIVPQLDPGAVFDVREQLGAGGGATSK